MDIVCDISLRQCKHFLLSRRQFQMLINTLYTGITMTNMELLDNTFEMENQQQPNGEKKMPLKQRKDLFMYLIMTNELDVDCFWSSIQYTNHNLKE